MTENSDKNKNVAKVGLFLGCVIPTEQYAYEISLRRVLPELGVALEDVDGFSCCGAPLRSINLNLSMYLSLRNLAICEMAGLDILAPCPICHLALTEALNFYSSCKDLEDGERYKSMLAEEGLQFKGEIKLYHTLDLLHDVIGLDKIKNQIKTPLTDIKFACHYGCHLIRPTDSGRPDNAEHPEKMENILSVLGANMEASLKYPEKLNCCGGPLILNLPDSALTKTGQKLQAIQEQTFDGLVDLCPWGHRLFDSRQNNAADTVGAKLDMPVFYLTQLLGLSMGIEPIELGLQLNLSPINKIEPLGLFPKQEESGQDTSENTAQTTTTDGAINSNSNSNTGLESPQTPDQESGGGQ
jgi:heterodisulfide reductase subunit B